MILTKEIADKKMRRMAIEVAERNYLAKEILLVGIRENGIFIARKIASYLASVFTGKTSLVELSLDKKNPGEVTLDVETNFNDKIILLIDDVANSGRTMLYALKPILAQLPAQVQTLALVARTHKQFPIAVDYVGLAVSTTQQETIVVEVAGGEVMGAWLVDSAAKA